MLPDRAPKEPKREKRWRSPAHCDHARAFKCAMCGSTAYREAAHVRMLSQTALGRKPDDWRVVALCKGPFANIDGQLGCHDRQHIIGEPAFWDEYEQKHGQTVWDLLESLIDDSPKRQDIRRIMRERGVGLTSAHAASR
jgi:hypothetical protein